MFSAVIGHAAKYSHVHVAARVSSYSIFVLRATAFFCLPSSHFAFGFHLSLNLRRCLSLMCVTGAGKKAMGKALMGVRGWTRKTPVTGRDKGGKR